MPVFSLRAPSVPILVTVIAVVLGLFASFLGVSALIDPSRALGYVSGADALGTNWGGRNLGLGVVLLVAVTLRRPVGYAVAFAGQLMRELGDVIATLSNPAGPNLAGVGFTMIFVAADLVGLGLSARAVRSQTRRNSPSHATAPR